MTTKVTRNQAKQRYEITVDDILAGFTEVIQEGDVVTFPHTLVFDQFEGQGVAAKLVGEALDDIRVRGGKVVATCPYVARFISRHPDYSDLLA